MKSINAIHRQKMPKGVGIFPQISRKTRKAFYLEVSKYFIDLTKLIFGGLILTNIINFNVDKTIIFALGLFSMGAFIIAGLILFLKGKE